MSAGDRRVERLREPDDFRKVFALATGSALLLITVVVVSRRVSGAFTGPVEPAVPCLVATFAAVLSLGALALWTSAAAPTAFSRRQIFTAAAAVALVPPLALGAALCVSASAFAWGYLSALAVAAVCGAVAIEDRSSGFQLANRVRTHLFQAERWPRFDGPVANEQNPIGAGAPLPASNCQATADTIAATTAAVMVEEVGTSVIATEESPVDESAADDAITDDESPEMSADDSAADASIVQWMTRRRLPDGREVIEGAVRIDLVSGNAVGVAHLSFSPPLACDPRTECHLLSDFDGRVRVTAAKSYGLRIEARQSREEARAAEINVAFSAETPPTANRAAAA